MKQLRMIFGFLIMAMGLVVLGCSNPAADPAAGPAAVPVTGPVAGPAAGPAALATYSVTYLGNSNTGGSVPDNQTKTQGTALTLAADSGTLVRLGYSFGGWNTAADGSGTTYAAGATYTTDAALALYAKWLTNVTFAGLIANGRSGTLTTTVLTLSFDVEPTTLAASDITVTGATKGTLGGTGLTRTLGISAIMVANGENVGVALANPAGCTIATASKAVAINYYSLGLSMVTVPAGMFQRDADPLNISVITTAFRMSQKEITRAQFVAMLTTDPVVATSNTSSSTGTTDPVQMANWFHAIAFCNKLSIAEGLTPVYGVSGISDWTALDYASIPIVYDTNWNAATATWANNGYRLPTEMEWEWAAMGATSDGRSGDIIDGVNTGGNTKGYAGSVNAAGAQTNIGNYAWNGANANYKTHPAGTKTANELGLCDMSGNVEEWNWDCYAFSYYPSGTLTDYRGADSVTNYRVERGGSWGSVASDCALASHYGNLPSQQNRGLGFRVVRP